MRNAGGDTDSDVQHQHSHGKQAGERAGFVGNGLERSCVWVEEKNCWSLRSQRKINTRFSNDNKSRAANRFVGCPVPSSPAARETSSLTLTEFAGSCREHRWSVSSPAQNTHPRRLLPRPFMSPDYQLQPLNDARDKATELKYPQPGSRKSFPSTSYLSDAFLGDGRTGLGLGLFTLRFWRLLQARFLSLRREPTQFSQSPTHLGARSFPAPNHLHTRPLPHCDSIATTLISAQHLRSRRKIAEPRRASLCFASPPPLEQPSFFPFVPSRWGASRPVIHPTHTTRPGHADQQSHATSRDRSLSVVVTARRSFTATRPVCPSARSPAAPTPRHSSTEALPVAQLRMR